MPFWLLITLSLIFHFLQESLKKLGLPPLSNPVIDTLPLSRFLFPESKRHTLGALCNNLEVKYEEESAHRADYDAQVLNDVFSTHDFSPCSKNIIF